MLIFVVMLLLAAKLSRSHAALLPSAVGCRAAVCSHIDVHSHTAAAMLLYVHAAMPLSVAMCYTASCSLPYTQPSATMQPPAAICC
jgi:hypothetical protein